MHITKELLPDPQEDHILEGLCIALCSVCITPYKHNNCNMYIESCKYNTLYCTVVHTPCSEGTTHDDMHSASVTNT
jgi:hypothetical protein